MKVSDIVLATYAENVGRPELPGAVFPDIFAKSLPWVVPSMCLFLKFFATAQDKGIHRLEIRLVGADGTFRRAEGAMTVTEDDPDDSQISMPVHFRDTVFKTAGNYNFQIFINGELGGSRRLRVTRGS